MFSLCFAIFTIFSSTASAQDNPYVQQFLKATVQNLTDSAQCGLSARIDGAIQNDRYAAKSRYDMCQNNTQMDRRMQAAKEEQERVMERIRQDQLDREKRAYERQAQAEAARNAPQCTYRESNGQVTRDCTAHTFEDWMAQYQAKQAETPTYR